MEIQLCGAVHPDDPRLTCGERPGLHEFHSTLGAFAIRWPNEEYVMPPRAPLSRQSQIQMMVDIARNAEPERHAPDPNFAWIARPEVTQTPVDRTDSRSLDEARRWLEDRLDDGAECPCCGNFTKVYRRVLNSGMARALIVIYRSFGRDFGDLPTLLMAYRESKPLHPLGGEEPKLRYWGLLEELADTSRLQGNQGFYRVTEAGEQWVLGRSCVPKYALVVNTRCLGLEGEPWSIRNALGKKFDLVELLNEAPFPVPPSALP